MPKLSVSVPKYRKHRASGQAVVTIGGKDYYLGPHGTKASKTQYDRLVLEWLAAGRLVPEEEHGLTVSTLCAEFWRYAQRHYVKRGTPTGTAENYKPALSLLRKFYGSTPAANGGTITLSATDDPEILAIAGALATAGLVGGSDNAVSGGISVAENEITSRVHSFVTNSIVHASGDLSLTASQENAKITAYTVGGAIARSNNVTLTVGATVASNTITADVQAYISNSADVVTTAPDSIKLEAKQLSTIRAYSVAASIAVSTGDDGFALAGGGARATNEIFGNANAYLLDSEVTGGKDVMLTAASNSTIDATVAGLAVAGSGGPAALGIGVSLATNTIGTIHDDGTTTPFEVRAYVQNSSIDASSGNLTQTATSASTVTSTVVAASAAVTAESEFGVGLGGAGADSTNHVAMWVQAAIDGDRSDGIHATGISLIADDTSKITAITVGASLVASVAGETGGAIAVGVSLAENKISNRIEAAIKNADNVVSTDPVTLSATDHSSIHTVSVAASVAVALSKEAGFSASGTGAESTNRITTKTNAWVQNSALTASGHVTITSDAGSAAGSEALTPMGDFTAGLDDAATTDLLEYDTTIGGIVYKVGSPDPTDFAGDNTFKTILRNQLARSPVGIELSTDPNDLAVTIRKVDTGADPIDPADDTGVEWSVTDRKSGTSVIIAKDTLGNFTVFEPQISAVVVGASLAFAIGKEGGAGLAIGASVARNLIGSDQDESAGMRRPAIISKNHPGEVQARILNSSVTATGGNLVLTATAQQSIDAFVGSFAAAVGGGKEGGLAGAGAGAKLPLANPSSMTVYDPTSRTLFVSDKIANSVSTYVNEGLYWRYSTPLAGWISGKTAGFGIDMDLDAVNGRLAVGTTADYVYVFQRQTDGTWSNGQAVNGTAMGGDFGKSVAIDGNRLVVGAPAAKVKYYSTNQGKAGYALDLGLGPATTTSSTTATDPSSATSSSVGAAHLYSLSGGNWTYNRLLMPDDANLPTTTSTYVAQVGPSQYVGQIGAKIYFQDSWSVWPTASSGEINLSRWWDYNGRNFSQTCLLCSGDGTVAVRVGPRTTITLIDEDLIGDSKSRILANLSYTDFREIPLSKDPDDLLDYRNDVDKLSWTTEPIQQIDAVST